MSWIQDIFAPQDRTWESFYRNRWSYDKKVRSTHGVNCTGSCSWEIYVKNGVVVWELQALDYPIIDRSIPPYEPRGCQRGISYSWYIYSPLRVKYPYVRGMLLDLWRKAKKSNPDDPIAAWRSIVTDPEQRQKYHTARGKGGFRRCTWAEVNEIMAAANLHTIQRHGPDRIVGFSPIPAMSMVSYAGGARFCQLMGGISLSFYDWYCDLPPASPEIWGEQTDVAESADWSHSKFIATFGSNVLMTRTPDAHFLVEARQRSPVRYQPPANVDALACDVTKESSCRRAVAEGARRLGGLDALVYASGISPLQLLAEAGQSDWRAALDVNLIGASLVTAAALPALRESRGRAVYSGSYSERQNLPGISLYSVSKSALSALIAAWRMEQPEVDFTKVVLGNTSGTEFAQGWGLEQTLAITKLWVERGLFPAPKTMPLSSAAEAIMLVCAGRSWVVARIQWDYSMEENDCQRGLA